MSAPSSIAVGLLADVTLGKMLQTAPKSGNDKLRPYLRAAHVQPDGVLDLSVEPHEMWFAPNEAEQLDLRAGDTVVVEGGVGGYGRAAYVSKDLPGLGFQNSIIRLRANTAADGRYLAHALISARNNRQIEMACLNAAMPHFTAEKVARFRVPFHEPADRRRIADYLDRETGEIDAMLGKMDELVEMLLDRRARAIRASLSGFPRAALGYHCRIFNGSTPLRSRADFWTETDGYPWLNSAAVNDPLVTSAPRMVTSMAMRDCHLPRVRPNDVLMGITGQGRTRGMVAVSGIDCTISQHVAAIRPESGWDTRFLFHALGAEYHLLRDQSEGGGSTKGAITCEMLTQYRIPVPPTLNEQKRIADHLDEDTTKIDAMLAKVSELKSLLIERRAALITDVVTGKKKIA